MNGKHKQSPEDQNSSSTVQDSNLRQRSQTAYSTMKTLLPVSVASDPSVAEQGPARISPELRRQSIHERGNVVLSREEESDLLPGYMPPTYDLFDVFPFSIITRRLAKTRMGRKKAGLRARLQSSVSHNIPLEISLYMVSPNFYDVRKSSLFSRVPMSPHCKNENFWTFLQLVRASRSSILVRFGDVAQTL